MSRFLYHFLALGLFITSVYSSPALIHSIKTFNGEKTGRVLVTLKTGTARSKFLDGIGFKKSNITLTHEWNIVNGFAGHFNEELLNTLRSHPEVESIAEDGLMHTTVTQTNAPWGLSRLTSSTKLSNQDTSSLTFPYTYDASVGAGQGADIYIVDTGIFTSHSQFGGRARWGATYGPYVDADGNGHGTHCAGTAAGSQFGVAKQANLIAVKVLSDSGTGAISDIVSGLNWVLQQYKSSPRPTVVSMSLSGAVSTTLDSAVTALTNAGIHVTVAAGNEAGNAMLSSPARVPSANTIGAATITDAAIYWSNYGPAVDLWAPGVDIISAWIGSTTATNMLTGTSMATPHVAGLIACLLSARGSMSPAVMSDLLKSISQKGILSGIYSGTVNNLAHQ